MKHELKLNKSEVIPSPHGLKRQQIHVLIGNIDDPINNTISELLKEVSKKEYDLKIGLCCLGENVMEFAGRGSVDIFILILNNGFPPIRFDSFDSALENLIKSLQLITKIKTKHEKPLIVLSDRIKDPSLIERAKLAADFFFPLPFNPDEFKKAIKKCFDLLDGMKFIGTSSEVILKKAGIEWQTCNGGIIDLDKIISNEHDVASAKKILQETVQNWGPTHPYVVRHLNRLAEAYDRQGQYEKAELVYKRSLEVNEKAVGPDHPDLAETLNNLAELYQTQGQFVHAEPLYIRTMAIKEKNLEPNDIVTAKRVSNLADLYRVQGQITRAELLLKHWVEIFEEAFGPDDPDVARCLNNLAELYQAQGQFARAEPLYKRSVTIYEQAVGPNPLLLAIVLDNLAKLYHAQGQFAQAKILFKRSMAIREREGEKKKEEIANMDFLFESLEQERKHLRPQKISGLKNSLEINEKALGPDHPDLAHDLYSLALEYHRDGQYAEAEPLYKRALAIFEKSFDPDQDHYLVVDLILLILEQIARIYLVTNREKEAGEVEERVARIRASIKDDVIPSLE
jgi:tetratricopeptide (TPR) repeat protein